mmetsp:Transcript_10973/g.36322  ORF Transcript_10973/g.36322 Transcript_10973/m.36322 type:complete len:211 (-) Transcript_10973:602-1234(-)
MWPLRGSEGRALSRAWIRPSTSSLRSERRTGQKSRGTAKSVTTLRLLLLWGSRSMERRLAASRSSRSTSTRGGSVSQHQSPASKYPAPGTTPRATSSSSRASASSTMSFSSFSRAAAADFSFSRAVVVIIASRKEDVGEPSALEEKDENLSWKMGGDFVVIRCRRKARKPRGFGPSLRAMADARSASGTQCGGYLKRAVSRISTESDGRW